MTKPSLPLFASLAKIKNANTKLGELAVLINGFMNGSKVTVRTQLHEGLTYVIAGLNASPGEEICLKVGEVSGQLRDALDKMTVALVKLNGRGLSGVGFPFGGVDKVTGKPEPFPTRRHDHLEKKLTPEQWKLILAQEPHPRGNATLWGVNQVANCDKHWEGLVDVQISPALENFGIGNGYVDRLITHPSWPEGLMEQHETERALLALGRAVPEAQGSVRVGVVFGEIPPVAGREVLVTLQRQAAEVERIVQLFLRTFF